MLYSIQYLRGLAAILVLFHHVVNKGAQYAGDPVGWFKVGPLGVDLFFIISGFIMCYTTADKAGRKGAVPQFLKNRFIRILPLYWALTLAGTAVFLLFPDKVNIGGGETRILESFLLLPTDGGFVIKNGWTLSYEFFFYFLFSLGLLLPAKRGLLMTATILLVLPLSGMLWGAGGFSSTGTTNPWFHFLTDPILLDFIGGILIFEIYSRWNRIPLLFSLVLIAMGVFLGILLNQGVHGWIPFGEGGLTTLCFASGVVFLESRLRKKELPFLTLLGDASYSLYLVHPFALAGGAIILSWLGFSRGPWTTVFVLTLLAGALVTGVLCYFWLEKPLTRWVKNYLGGRDRKQLASLDGLQAGTAASESEKASDRT